MVGQIAKLQNVDQKVINEWLECDNDERGLQTITEEEMCEIEEENLNVASTSKNEDPEEDDSEKFEAAVSFITKQFALTKNC